MVGGEKFDLTNEVLERFGSLRSRKVAGRGVPQQAFGGRFVLASIAVYFLPPYCTKPKSAEGRKAITRRTACTTRRKVEVRLGGKMLLLAV